MIRIVPYAILIPLAIVGIVDVFPHLMRMPARILVGTIFPQASSVYAVNVHNDTAHPLLIETSIINDRDFQTRSFSQQGRDFQGGWPGKTRQIIDPNSSHLCLLPSETDPRFGIVQVTAMTQIETNNISQSQRIAMTLVRWPDLRQRARNASEFWAQEVHIGESDLVKIYPARRESEDTQPVSLADMLQSLDYSPE